MAASGCWGGQLSDSGSGRARSSVEAVVSCAPLDEGDTVRDVGPEGDVWVSGPMGLRLFNAFAEGTAIETQFSETETVVAWTPSRAFVVGDNVLWSAGTDGSTAVALPSQVGNPDQGCGDPGALSGAFVLGTRGLFERRNGSWWRWDLPVELQETLTLRAVQGACSAEQQSLYFTADDKLWKVNYGQSAFFYSIADLDGATEIVADSVLGIVGLHRGRLTREQNGAWVELAFEEGAVSHLGAAAGVLWATVGSRVYRRDRLALWEVISTPLPIESIEAVHAYAAGGAWLVGEGQLCHLDYDKTVRVHGVRPYQRLGVGTMPGAVQVSANAAMSDALTARLDGRRLDVSGSAGAWALAPLPELVEGWHELQLRVQGSGGVAQRTVSFLVEDETVDIPDPTVFYDSDIKPIFDRACGSCHGAGGTQRFLDGYEEFVAVATGALAFVQSGQMPPPPLPGLSAEEVALVEQWIEEGMAP